MGWSRFARANRSLRTEEWGIGRQGGLRARLWSMTPPLLQQTSFRRFWTAQTISYFGDQITFVALPLTAVLALHANAAQVGLLSAAGSLPSLIFALHAGAFVDQFGRRRKMMILADLLRAALLLTVPITYWLGQLTIQHLYIVAFLTGSLAVVFGICANSLFVALVPRDDFVRGNSLVKGSYYLSWVAGPTAGGALIQAVSGPISILCDVVSFIGSALLLRSISPEEPPRIKAGRGHLSEGFLFIRRASALLAKFFIDASLNFFYTIYFTLLFLFAAKELRLSALAIGLVLAAGAVGAVVGSALTTRVSLRIGVGPAFLVGSFIYPGALVLAPIAGGPQWLAAGLLVIAEFTSGVGLMICDISGSSIQQALTPDRLRGRVQGAFMLFNNGFRPFGALLGGALGTWLGLRPTLWVASIGGVLSVMLILPSSIRRMRTLPEEADFPVVDSADA